MKPSSKILAYNPAMFRHSRISPKGEKIAYNLPVCLLIYIHTLRLFRTEKNVKVAKLSNLKIENVRAKIACVTSVNLPSAHSFW